MLFAFHHKRLPENVIARKAGTRPDTGTARSAMLRAARSQGFTCRMNSSATWSDVLDCLKEGMPVLIEYREPSSDEGHYSLVVGTRGKEVLLHDPWNGMQFTMNAHELKERWHSHRTKEKNRGWMMTVMPRAESVHRTHVTGMHIRTFA